jgi:small-conductance mechanosensitive channel/CRP-like cAMP-binding protein
MHLLPANLLFPIAGTVVAANYVAGVYWRRRSPRILFVVRLLGFAVLTALFIAAGVEPYQRSRANLPGTARLLYGGLEVVWWMSGAWLAVGFFRAFVSFGGRAREAKLVQDLVAGVIYACAAVAVAADVFDLPIKGLLATSGALAVIIGLALQNSLGDVFSGIVLNIERPYRVGDWIIVDASVEGLVIEQNWRATHLLTGRQDVAIVPNSVIAKLKVVNCSAPSKKHGHSLRIKLEPTLSPAAASELLRGVLLGVNGILSSPAPSVSVRDLSAESMELELFYAVADIGAVDAAQNEFFERLHRAMSATGLRFAPRLGPYPDARRRPSAENMPERLLSGLEIFASLTPEEKQHLAEHMARRVYKPGALVAAKDTVSDALNILAAGVLVASEEKDGISHEVFRLAPGDYFGELGVLTGAPSSRAVTALTRAVVYELPADALAPLLKHRPVLAELLSENLAARRQTLAASVKAEVQEAVAEPLSRRVATTIRRILSF